MTKKKVIELKLETDASNHFNLTKKIWEDRKAKYRIVFGDDLYDAIIIDSYAAEQLLDLCNKLYEDGYKQGFDDYRAGIR